MVNVNSRVFSEGLRGSSRVRYCPHSRIQSEHSPAGETSLAFVLPTPAAPRCCTCTDRSCRCANGRRNSSCTFPSRSTTTFSTIRRNSSFCSLRSRSLYSKPIYAIGQSHMESQWRTIVSKKGRAWFQRRVSSATLPNWKTRVTSATGNIR